MRPRLRLAAQLVGTLAFVLVCGAPASAVRAWAMSVVASAGTLVGRRLDGASSACLVALAMALVEPGLSGQLGFLLSVTCVVALCLFSSYATLAVGMLVPSPGLSGRVSAEARIRLRSARQACVGALGASVVAQVASLPLVAPVYGCVSLVAPIAALLAAGPLSGALALGIVGVILAPLPTASHVVLGVCDCLLRLTLAMLKALSRLPYASVPVGGEPSSLWALVLLGALALLVTWPKPSKAVVRGVVLVVSVATVVVLARWRFLAPARICVLDVGQGDAILIQDGSSAVLVDAGPPDGAVVEALAREHVLHLDAVVLTHLHDDHYGGVEDLAGHVGVGAVFVANGAAENVPDELLSAVQELTGRSCLEVSYHTRLQVGRFLLEVVWPRGTVSGLQNPDSLIMTVAYQSGSERLDGLLTGDAERDELGSVIAAGEVRDIDFLKVGHHGSEVSITAGQAAVLSPEVAVASAGMGNAYGHPRDECVNALVSAGARFLCTKDVGDVELRPARDGLVVR